MKNINLSSAGLDQRALTMQKEVNSQLHTCLKIILPWASVRKSSFKFIYIYILFLFCYLKRISCNFINIVSDTDVFSNT